MLIFKKKKPKVNNKKKNKAEKRKSKKLYNISQIGNYLINDHVNFTHACFKKRNKKKNLIKAAYKYLYTQLL